MDPDSMILLAVLVAMVAMSGYFSATEKIGRAHV